MDWTSVFAVIGTVFLLVCACVTVSTVTVLAWIGGKHVLELYRDEQRSVAMVDRMADEYLGRTSK